MHKPNNPLNFLCQSHFPIDDLLSQDAKINLGLHITSNCLNERDGYQWIETCMVPIPLMMP